MDSSSRFDLYEAEILTLLDGLENGVFTSVQLTQAYLDRINEINVVGPKLNAVIEVNAAALEQAKKCDEQRQKEKQERKGFIKSSQSESKSNSTLGSLHGIPILIKDNIATKSPPGYEENMNTTSGSLALVGSYPSVDATVARKLRESGAIILGKTNMSEWAAWRAEPFVVPSGWSSYGGQCYSPYYPKANPSGSSSGCGTAAAVGLAAGTLGSETDGSITFPSSRCNIVGLKPTVGLTSRMGVIPISKTQDSVGPMCRTVSDAAIVLQVIAGPDEHDPYTINQPPIPDYLSALHPDYIKRKRIGVLRSIYCERSAWEKDSEVTVTAILEAFEKAIETMKSLGAEIVENVVIPTAKEIFDDNFVHEGRIFDAEMKEGINNYLASIPDCPTGVRTLADVIEYNRTHDAAKYQGEERQNYLINSNQTPMDAAYEESLRFCKTKAGPEGMDKVFESHQLDALIAPFSDRCPQVSAEAGYPILSVPLGFAPDSIPFIDDEQVLPPGGPFGLVFMGEKWSESTLLGCAYSFEQATKVRLQRKAYEDAIPKSQVV